MRLGKMKERSFGVLASFRLSYPPSLEASAVAWASVFAEATTDQVWRTSCGGQAGGKNYWPLTLALSPLGGARGNLRSVWRSKLRLRQRPMIGTTTRQKSKLDLPSKILAPHGYSFSSNALVS